MASQDAVKTQILRALKSNRERSGKTQQDMADAMFVSRDTVSKWENGRRNIRAEDLSSIASAYGIRDLGHDIGISPEYVPVPVDMTDQMAERRDDLLGMLNEAEEEGGLSLPMLRQFVNDAYESILRGTPDTPGRVIVNYMLTWEEYRDLLALRQGNSHEIGVADYIDTIRRLPEMADGAIDPMTGCEQTTEYALCEICQYGEWCDGMTSPHCMMDDRGQREAMLRQLEAMLETSVPRNMAMAREICNVDAEARVQEIRDMYDDEEGDQLEDDGRQFTEWWDENYGLPDFDAPWVWSCVTYASDGSIVSERVYADLDGWDTAGVVLGDDDEIEGHLSECELAFAGEMRDAVESGLTCVFRWEPLEEHERRVATRADDMRQAIDAWEAGTSEEPYLVAIRTAEGRILEAWTEPEAYEICASSGCNHASRCEGTVSHSIWENTASWEVWGGMVTKEARWGGRG